MFNPSSLAISKPQVTVVSPSKTMFLTKRLSKLRKKKLKGDETFYACRCEKEL